MQADAETIRDALHAWPEPEDESHALAPAAGDSMLRAMAVDSNPVDILATEQRYSGQPQSDEEVLADAAVKVSTPTVSPGKGLLSARQLGQRLVGTRLSVWWEDDEAWYDGTVAEYSHALGQHLIRYDDGEQTQEALDTCRWKRLTAQASNVRKRPAPAGSEEPPLPTAPEAARQHCRYCFRQIERAGGLTMHERFCHKRPSSAGPATQPAPASAVAALAVSTPGVVAETLAAGRGRGRGRGRGGASSPGRSRAGKAKPAAPRAPVPLPSTAVSPFSCELDDDATTALLLVWQFARVFAPHVHAGFVPPSLRELESALLSSAPLGGSAQIDSAPIDGEHSHLRGTQDGTQDGAKDGTQDGVQDSAQSSAQDSALGELHAILLERLLPMEDAAFAPPPAPAPETEAAAAAGKGRQIEGFPAGWMYLERAYAHGKYKIYFDPHGKRFNTKSAARDALEQLGARSDAASVRNGGQHATSLAAAADGSAAPDSSVTPMIVEGGAQAHDAQAQDAQAHDAQAHDAEVEAAADALPGIGVRCLRDALPLLRESRTLVWPELLRLAVCQWKADAELISQSSTAVRRTDLSVVTVEPPDEALLELAAYLAHSEYPSASPSLKARALHALCERALCAPTSLPSDCVEELERLGRERSQAAAALRLAQQEAAALGPVEGVTSRQQQLARSAVEEAVSLAEEELSAVQSEEAERSASLRDAIRLRNLGKDRQGVHMQGFQPAVAARAARAARSLFLARSLFPTALCSGRVPAYKRASIGCLTSLRRREAPLASPPPLPPLQLPPPTATATAPIAPPLSTAPPVAAARLAAARQAHLGPARSSSASMAAAAGAWLRMWQSLWPCSA